MVKNPPANAGDSGDVGLIPKSEDPLEKEMVNHSSTLTWEIPWTEGQQEFIHTHNTTHTHTHTHRLLGNKIIR